MDPRTLTRAEVRELDRRATEEYGVPSLLLMENAGRAVAAEAEAMLGGPSGARAGETLVLVGPGNNGGDGLVVARTLDNRGRRVRAACIGPVAALERASADVRTNLALWRSHGGKLVEVATDAAFERLGRDLAGAALVVDALFGTGLARPLAGAFARAVDAIAASGAPVLAVDVPSGLDADTGRELGRAVRARATVTFVARKPGLALGAGPACAGRVVVAEIGIPRALLERS